MTGFIEPNGGTAYSTGNTISAASINTMNDNARSVFRRTLSSWTVFPAPQGTEDAASLRIPAYHPAWSSIFCVAAGTGTDPFLHQLSKGVVVATTYDWISLVSYSSLSNNDQLVCAAVDDGNILMLRTDDAATNWYLAASGGTTLGGTAFPAGESFIAGGPILITVDSLGNDLFVAPGRRGSSYPCVAVFPLDVSATSTLYDSATSSSVILRRMASDDAGVIVGVGGASTDRTIVLSDDYGATWTYSAYPTCAAGSTTAEPSVAYDAVLDVFVTTMLDTDGKIIYCSSSDGSSWGSWHRIPADAGGTITAALVESADIVIIGGTWVISRPFAPALSASKTVQVWASSDGGASWLDISPAQGINFTDGFWMVQLGNRIGISTNDWFALSEEFDSTTTASEAV